MFYDLLDVSELYMRSIDDIIADARQAAADSLREAFGLAAAERAIELRARFAKAFPEPPIGPAREAPSDGATASQGEPSRGEEPRTQRKLGQRAMLLSIVAILTLALWHARAARLLPACALLIGLGALLSDWSEDDPPE